MCLCMGKVPLPHRLVISYYPIMVFVSDPLCENILIYFLFYDLFIFIEKKKEKERKREEITHSSRQNGI
jgi:hypothetical protein